MSSPPWRSAEGIAVGEKRVARLMRAAGLQCAFKRRRKGCTVRVDGVQPFSDLVGPRLSSQAPDLAWCADIKQIRTGQGWLYLAAVQDLFSRRIVGWSMAAHMRAELVVDALTFFATLTKERLLHGAAKGGWATRAELRSAIFEYIERFYNPARLDSTLGMRSPVEYEADHAAGDPDGLAAPGRTRQNCAHLRLRTATTTTTT